jgi:hypothetical protein
VSLRLALVDAANNCARESARATLTLRSGREITGTLDKPGPLAEGDGGTVIVHRPGGGWATVLVEEIAAVESHR